MILFAALAGVLGLLIGSFLNVVIWRVPRGESIVRPASRCPGCGTPIAPRDNVPVVSWLLLRGRCRHCGEPISARYPAVELGTGLLFAALALRFGPEAELPAYLYLGAVCVALAAIDVDLHRLPDALTLPSYPVLALLLGVAAVVEGDTGRWLQALAAGAAMFAVYFLLVLAAPKGMGFGDVKLSGVLGIALGWLGWDVWAVGLVSSFLVGGLFGVVLLALGAGRKAKVPFGPFMVAGALLAVFAGEAVADIWLGV